MGAADDVKTGLTKNLATFTKQRIAEEKHSGALRFRTSRMREVRGVYIVEAVNAVMTASYMKASDDNKLPAKARQVYYVVRPLVEARLGKPLDYSYFSQTLLPDYIAKHEHAKTWNIVYDDRGHFFEPHTGKIFGLGTESVRDYLKNQHAPRFAQGDFAEASVKTSGPDGRYGAVICVEKEGFMPLLQAVRLEARYDIALTSSKGFATTAAKHLLEQLGRVHCWCFTTSMRPASLSKTRWNEIRNATSFRVPRPSLTWA